VPVPRA